MSRFDDRLTTELERAATPAEPAGAFEEIDRRRGRRAVVRRVQTGVLATLVLAGSIGGVLVLNRAFRGEGGTTTPAGPPAENGPIVVSFGDADSQHLYLQDPGDPDWDPRDHQLTATPDVYDMHSAVSPDGRTVVFVRYDSVEVRTAIWSVGIDGGDAQLISSEAFAYGPAFSPDGTTIALTTNRSGTDDGGILLMAPDGGDVRTVPNTDSDMQGVAWSPDGSRLAFESGARGGPHTVGLINVDGTGRVELPGTDSDTATAPAWSPDGRTIVFVRDRDVWVYDLEDRTARQITTFPNTEHGDTSPTWSPDGRLVAFERYVGPYERFLYVVEPDGSGLRRIGPGAAPAWGVAQADPPPSEAPATETSPPVEQTPGRDIGLDFNLCRSESLGGIDFLGNGAEGTAWVGGLLAANGSCPDEYEGDTVVAVDVDGDGLAESWAGPLARCVGCSPFAFSDLNGDGRQELVVTLRYGATTEYTLFSLQTDPGGSSPTLQQVTIAEPGAPPAFRAGRPVTFWVGFDAGSGGSLRCDDYPDQPVLVITQTNQPVEGPGSYERQVDVTRLVLRTDGTMDVIGSDSYTAPLTSGLTLFTGRACGLDLWPG